MKRSGYILVSALLSLLLHALLLACVERFLVRAEPILPAMPERPMSLSLVNVDDLVLNKPTLRDKLLQEAQDRLRQAAVSGPRVDAVIEKQDLALANPDVKVRLKGLGDSLLKPNLADPPKAMLPTAPPPVR